MRYTGDIKFRQEVENPMVRPTWFTFTPPTITAEVPECDVCGCRAHLMVKDAYYCWDCAEEEGIRRIKR